MAINGDPDQLRMFNNVAGMTPWLSGECASGVIVLTWTPCLAPSMLRVFARPSNAIFAAPSAWRHPQCKTAARATASASHTVCCSKVPEQANTGRRQDYPSIPLLAHQRPGGTNNVERASNVNIVHDFPVLSRHLMERRVFQRSGVADDNVCDSSPL